MNNVLLCFYAEDKQIDNNNNNNLQTEEQENKARQIFLKTDMPPHAKSESGKKFCRAKRGKWSWGEL